MRKDPHPTPDEFDTNVCDYLVDNPAPFRKLLEPFLCFVGIIRYYDLDENYYPTFWANDDEELDLFAFINHADPTKVRIREREGNANVQGTGNDNVNEEGGDATVADQTEQSDHVVQIRGIDITVDDEAQAIVTEKPKKVRKKRKVVDGASGSGLPLKKIKGRSCTLNVEVRITVAATVPFVTSSVTPTLEPEEGGRTDSVTGPNLRTQRAAERFVVLSDYSHHFSTNAADDEVTSIV
ncbi:hypothetical protein Tco_0055475, partial [Tanacetum coccineum]